MKYLILFLISFFLFSFTANKERRKIKNDIQKENLKGKVKVITESNYSGEANGEPIKESILNLKATLYNDQGNKILQYHCNADGIIEIMDTFKYDTMENIIEEGRKDNVSMTTYKFVDNDKGVAPNRNDYYVTKIYKYDERGLLIKEINYAAVDFLQDSIIYKYDNNGNLMDNIYYLPSGGIWNQSSCTYKYDNEGNKIALYGYNYTKPSETYQYDYKGNLIAAYMNSNTKPFETIKYDKEGDTAEMKNGNYKYTYIYDDKSKMIERNQYTVFDGGLWHKTTYTYDDIGNMIECNNYEYPYKNYKPDYFILNVETYKYDSIGNWLTYISKWKLPADMERSEHDQKYSSKIIGRKIEYYH